MRTDGSAQWSQGGTTVLAGVHGPLQAPQSGLDGEKAIIEVVFHPQGLSQGVLADCQMVELKKAAEGVILSNLHPLCTIRIIFHVLEDDGALMACCINAMNMALIDAGVPMKTMLAASSICALENNVLVMDPCKKEEESAQSKGYAAFFSHTDEILSIHIDGLMGCSNEALVEVLAGLKAQTEHTFSFMTQLLSQHIKQ